MRNAGGYMNDIDLDSLRQLATDRIRREWDEYFKISCKDALWLLDSLECLRDQHKKDQAELSAYHKLNIRKHAFGEVTCGECQVVLGWLP